MFALDELFASFSVVSTDIMRREKKADIWHIKCFRGFEKAEGDTTMKSKKKCHINSSG